MGFASLHRTLVVGAALIGGSSLLLATSSTADGSRACRAAQLSSSYTSIDLSQRGRSIAYLLTVRNDSPAMCRLGTLGGLTLLGRDREPVTTRAKFVLSIPSAITLQPGQWAHARSRVEIVGTPTEPSPCEPVAYYLRASIGGHPVIGRMDPIAICDQRVIRFARLVPVPLVTPCAAAQLRATFNELGDGNNGDGSVDYALVLRDTTGACYLDGLPRLQFLDARGHRVPTRVPQSVPAPIVIAGHGRASSVATLFLQRGPGEARHGPCEPLSHAIRISPSPGGGTLRAPVRPELHACDHGLIGDAALVPGAPFE